jgi:hypothetical protein
VHGNSDGRLGCQQVITHAYTLCVRPFPGVDRHVKAAGGVRHASEKGKVGSTQGRISVHVDEQVEGVLPIALRCGFTCPFQ